MDYESLSKEQLVELLKRIDNEVRGAEDWDALLAVCEILEIDPRT